MTEQEKALEEVEAFKWMTSKGYDRKASKDIAQILVKYKEEQLLLHGVGNCKPEPKLGKLETELGKLQKVHGDIVKYFDVHSGCDSFKFKDGAVYRVKLERSLGKATLD